MDTFTAPVIWAVHFLACYIGAANFCAKQDILGDDFAGLRIAIVTVFSLAMIAMSALLAWRQRGFGTGDPPHDVPT